jgi:AraC-like DNA-binding protein
MLQVRADRKPTLVRHPVAASASMRAEVLEMHDLNDEFTHESDTPRTQIVFPVQGLHYIGTGPREVLLDLNQVAFVPQGITTRDRHPSFGDVVCIVVTPSPELLDEVWRGPDAHLPDLAGDSCVIRPMEAADQMRAGLLATRACQQADNTAFEEILVDMLRRSVGRRSDGAVLATSRSLALVAKVKELLATTGELLSLSQIAHAIGASPAYLTDLFHRIEGMPIYRYQTRLRLARALGQLPHAEDITQLALELGFSSHSHFSSTFRSTFGITPSNYRQTARSRSDGAVLPPGIV